MADDTTPDEQGPEERRRRRALALLRRLDEHPWALAAAHAVRRRLPGDDRYGDPLSLGPDEAPGLVGRRLAEIAAERQSALRQAGFGALQVWQSLSEAQGRGHGDRELTILFTDLVGFSSWALEAGDEQAVELLRAVGAQVEPCVRARRGWIVKRLGDGIMAAFERPEDAVVAAHTARRALADVCVAGHRPRLRAGIHVGRPRRLGGDLFGVDVNVAARIAAAAGDEVLISDAVRERLADGTVSTRRRWRFSAKGAPSDLKVFVAEPSAGAQL